MAHSSEGKVELRYAFRNDGSTAAKILEVQVSCNCTVAELTKSIYAPKEAGLIILFVDTGGNTGLFEGTVTVLTDVPEQPAQKLGFRVSVTSERLDLRVQQVTWKIGGDPSVKVVPIDIVRHDDSIRPISAESENDLFAVEVKERLLPQGAAYELRITPRHTSLAARGGITIAARDVLNTEVVYKITAIVK